jgi:type VI secretion system Hcp family effector
MAKDMFIQITDCEGESTDKKHEKWIEIESWNWGVEQPTSGGSSTAGAITSQRVTHMPFVFTCKLDSAYVKLLKASCQGKHLKEAKVELLRATGDGNSSLYMQFVMKDLIISRVHSGSAPDSTSLPLVTVELTYGQIEWTYTPMDHATGKPQGKITAGHNLQTNEVK